MLDYFRYPLWAYGLITLLVGYGIANGALWGTYPDYLFQWEIIGFWIVLFKTLPNIPFNDIDNVLPKPLLYITIVTLTASGTLFWMSIANASKKHKYGKAAWASIFDIKKMGLLKETGIILGKVQSSFLRSRDPLSVLLLAPPGTGKTAGIIIPNLLHIKHSVIAYDVKGELYEKTAHYRESFSKVLVFDITQKSSSSFNVFAKNMLPAEEERVAYIQNIAQIFIKDDKNRMDGFFIKEARNIFSFLAQYLIHTNGWTSLPAMYDILLETPDFAAFLKKNIFENEIMPRHLKKIVNSILVNASSSKQWAAVMTELRQAFDIFNDPIVAQLCDTQESIINAERFREKSTTLYIKLSMANTGRSSTLAGTVFTALSYHLTSKVPTARQQPVTMIMDEFVKFGKCDTLVDLPSISRGYKVNTIFAAQDYGQIESLYDKSYVNALETNCAYKIIFQQNNFQTADMISKAIGHYTDKKQHNGKSFSSNRGLVSKSTNKGESLEAKLLITAQDVMNLPKDTSIVLVQGFMQYPIKAKIPLYYKDKVMDQLANMKPITQTEEAA